jgi:hypothetical protein
MPSGKSPPSPNKNFKSTIDTRSSMSVSLLLYSWTGCLRHSGSGQGQIGQNLGQGTGGYQKNRQGF